MSRKSSRIFAALELLTAATLWGSGFVTSIWVLDQTGAAHLTFLRFTLATTAILPFLVTASGRAWIRRYVRPAFVPGALLSIILILQSWGLLYTTATKSGFITTLYVVFVPLMEAVFNKRRISPFLWLCVLLSIVGMALIVNLELEGLNVGDALTLASAFLTGFQILAIAKVTKTVERPFVFNCVQSAWGALVAVPFAFWPGARVASLAAIAHWPAKPIVGILVLAFGSTVIAFALQLRAQVRLNPTVASLLFLLESPIAMVFAMVFLGDRMNATEFMGALLIMVSAVAAVAR